MVVPGCMHATATGIRSRLSTRAGAIELRGGVESSGAAPAQPPFPFVHPISLSMAASVHQTPLLWIPLKQTEDVDVATPVRSLISSSYGEDPKRYSSALAALARARTDALRGSPGSDRTARDLLYKWFHILEMLEVRFPELRVPFTWKDVSASNCCRPQLS